MLSRRMVLEAILSYALIPGQASNSSFQLPDLKGFTEEGKATRLSFYYGKPLLIHVWAAYCPHCIADMPKLNTLEQEIALLGLYDMARKDLEESKIEIGKIKTEQKHTAPNILLPQTSLFQLSDAYKTQTKEEFYVPTYFLLERSGICVHTQNGALTKEYLKLLQRKITQLQK
ncbi:MAG: TlpA disulfide reductase family protein [bacterium]|nr:TlpA disulfide reductase family protein [bacterium]